MRSIPARRHFLAAAALITLALAGCGGADPVSGAPAALTIKDPWVKAAPAGEMTAAFGVLTNDTERDITVTGAESPAQLKW